MRISEPAGGYGPVNGNTYTIKTEAVTAGSASGMSAAEIEQLFSYLDPGAVATAGKAHSDAADQLYAIADSVVLHVQKLQADWSGTAAQASLPQFQQLHESATTLANAAKQTGTVLSWLGNEILPQFASYKAPSNGVVGDVESFFGHNPQNAAAQAKMEELNGYLVQANGGLPASVTVPLPGLGSGGGHTGVTPGPAGPGGAGAAAAGLGLAGGAGAGASLAGGSGGGVSGVNPGGAGVTGGAAPGVGKLGTGPASPGAPTNLAGVTPGSGTGAGSGTGTGGGVGGVPGGGSPGGTVGTGGTDPVGLLPPVSSGSGSSSGDPDDGDPGDLGGLDGTDPAGVGIDPVGVGVGTDGVGAGGVGTDGVGTDGVGTDGVGTDGVGTDGVGADPVGGMDPLPVGGLGGGSFGVGDDGTGVGSIGGKIPGEGLSGEDMVDAAPGDSALIGSDGMIGAGPGGLDAEALNAGFADSGFGAGNTGATGFVGADGAAAGTDGVMADAQSGSPGGFPMTGTGNGGRQEKERYRQAWMAEDADVWEGEAGQVPPVISA